MSLGAFSPFASPAVNLMRLHECSADFKALAAQPSPAERNTQQLEKCMTLLDMILGELVDAPRDFSWKNGLGGLHAALQSAIQLLQLVTGAGSVAAFITRRFTSHYQAVAQGLRQALAGLIADDCGLEEDTIDSIEHLQRRLSQAKFSGDVDEDRVADEVRLHATLLELGRSGQQQGLRNIWAAICSASKQELSADDLQGSIDAIKTHIIHDTAFSSSSDQKMLTHLICALELQINSPNRAVDELSGLHRGGSLGGVHRSALGQLGHPQRGGSLGVVGPGFRSAIAAQDDSLRRSKDIMRSSSGDSGSTTTVSLPVGSMATGAEDMNTDTSWRSSDSPLALTDHSDKGQNLTGGSDKQSSQAAKPLGPRGMAPTPASRSQSGGAAASTSARRLASTDGAEQDTMQSQRASSGSAPPPPTLHAMVAGKAPRADWVILPDDLTICKKDDGSDFLLGRGAYGQVFKAVLNSVEPVALKLLGSRDQEPDPDSTARAIRELELLRDCRNPRIVQFLGASIFNRQVGIVTELMPLGDLHSALAGAVLKWGPKALRVALDVARGLAFLHHRKIAHLDLKSPNILLGRDYTAKIADVGIAKVLTGSHMSTVTSLGTFAWAAPELLVGLQVTVAADIYSFGVVLWELVTGEQPKRGQLRPIRVPGEASEAVSDLITACLTWEAAQRPDARAVVQALQAIIPEMSQPPAPVPSSSPRGPTAPSDRPFPPAALSNRPSPPAPLSNMSSPPAPLSNRPSPPPAPSISGPELLSSPRSSATYESPPRPRPSGGSLTQPMSPPAGLRTGSDSQLANWLHDTSHTEMSEIAAAADMSDRMSEAGSMDGEATRSIRFPSTNNAKLERELQELCQPGCTKREYSLAERGLRETESHAVAIMLAHNHSLHRFNFGRNVPESHGVNRLMAALKRNRTLVSLDLRYCNLGRNGGKEIADMLRKNSSLQELMLWSTGLRQDGASHVLRALHSNSSLQRLDLGCNELGPEVGKEVAEMLRRNTGLTSLDLRNNRLGKAGLLSIAEGVQPNSSLRTLKLSNNNTSLLSGMSSAKSLFKQKASQSGLNTTLS